ESPSTSPSRKFSASPAHPNTHHSIFTTKTEHPKSFTPSHFKTSPTPSPTSRRTGFSNFKFTPSRSDPQFAFVRDSRANGAVITDLPTGTKLPFASNPYTNQSREPGFPQSLP